MPLYEYECQTCFILWEELQKISDPVIETCPFCEAANPKKLISAVNFVLSGGGWYKDGYSGTSNKQKEKK
jgi:putative FmdB family regulatory protein